MDIFSTGYTASTLIANVTSGAQDTFASLGPILALVAGVVVAFIVARYVIGLFKHVGRASK